MQRNTGGQCWCWYSSPSISSLSTLIVMLSLVLDLGAQSDVLLPHVYSDSDHPYVLMTTPPHHTTPSARHHYWTSFPLAPVVLTGREGREGGVSVSRTRTIYWANADVTLLCCYWSHKLSRDEVTSTSTATTWKNPRCTERIIGLTEIDLVSTDYSMQYSLINKTI